MLFSLSPKLEMEKMGIVCGLVCCWAGGISEKCAVSLRRLKNCARSSSSAKVSNGVVGQNERPLLSTAISEGLSVCEEILITILHSPGIVFGSGWLPLFLRPLLVRCCLRPWGFCRVDG